MRGYKWIVSPCSFGKVLVSWVVYLVFEKNLMVEAFRFLNQKVHGDKDWKFLTDKSWILDGFHNVYGFSNQHWKNCNTYLFPQGVCCCFYSTTPIFIIAFVRLPLLRCLIRLWPVTLLPLLMRLRDDELVDFFGFDPPKLIGESTAQLLDEHVFVRNRF